jgi:large subunit ribosomal protein L19
MSEEKKVQAETEVAAKEVKKDKVAKEESANPDDLKPGMTIRVYIKIKELSAKGEEKERLQYFEGMIIARKHGKEKGATITVRKTSEGVGVEKIFPLNAPTIDKIIIKKVAKVRSAKLYHFRRGYNKTLKEKAFKK